jgi:hypothetical protein
MLRIVQIQREGVRRLAVVDEPDLRLIADFDSLHTMVMAAITQAVALSQLAQRHLTDESLEYGSIYNGASDWRLLVPLDHPAGPAGMLVSGTGLTHFGSARDRNAMHSKAKESDEANLTDSMKMFRWGVEGGRPSPGAIGIAPEWFFKGNGGILRAHGESLEIPAYAEDGGEEAEIAGCYVIGPDGVPYRVGMATANEFSDHRFEKRNYLNLAGSKLRTCSIGPEITVDSAFDAVAGEVKIERDGGVLWSKGIRTGGQEMCHSLTNIEHHHFKFENHRRPGDVHIHYFGAHSLSFGDGVRLQDRDVMSIRWDGFGRALRNPVRVISNDASKPVMVLPLG